MSFISDGTCVGFGKETTFGTPVSRATWHRLQSFSGGRKVEFAMRSTLCEATGSLANRKKVKMREAVAFTVKFLLGYEGCGLILSHVLRDTWSTTGSGPYTHVAQLGRDHAQSLTVEVVHGDGSGEVFNGCCANKATIEIGAEGLVSMTVEFIGRSSGGRVAAATPTFTTNELELNVGDGATLSWNSLTPSIRSLRVLIDHKISGRKLAGSYVVALPKPTGRPDVAFEVESDYDADDTYDAQIAGDEADATITFTLDTRSFAITLHNAHLDEASLDISSIDVIPERLRLVGKSDGTDDGIEFTVVNSQSSAIAA